MKHDNIITKLFIASMAVTIIAGWDVAHSTDIIAEANTAEVESLGQGVSGKDSAVTPVASASLATPEPVTPTPTPTPALEATTESQKDISKMDIARLIVDEFGYGKDAQIALAVFQCESGLNPNAINRDNWLWGGKGEDHGIAQVNDFYHKNKFDSVDQLYDPVFNIKLAKKIWQQSGWTAWSCYKSGAYERFMK